MKLLTKYVCKQMTDVKLLMLHSNTLNRLKFVQKKKKEKKNEKKWA